MPPGRGSLPDEITKNTKPKHEWLKGVSLEHIGTGFVNLEYKQKEKLFLRIFNELLVSYLIPLLGAHYLNVSVMIAGGCKYFTTLFRILVDT